MSPPGNHPVAAALPLVFAACLSFTAPISAVADEAAGAPRFSSDPAAGAAQRAVYEVVHRYETLLNAGDTAGILALYAPDSVAEWNDKPTFASRKERQDAYDALFKVAKFSTVFGYAAIDVYGEIGVVRTFHHKGAVVLEGGKEVVDLNREVFVLRKFPDGWKIILYTFNTDRAG